VFALFLKNGKKQAFVDIIYPTEQEAMNVAEQWIKGEYEAYDFKQQAQFIPTDVYVCQMIAMARAKVAWTQLQEAEEPALT
jgi:hypothetical protein